MSFAMKLQEIRQNNGISQEKLAEILNVSRQSVSKWERGKGYPEIDKLIFISEHFGVSLDELLKGTKRTKERKPIDLVKPSDREIREVYPNGDGNAYTYENTQTQTKTSSPVQPAMNIARYGNYSCTASNSGMSSTAPQPKIRRRKINTKLSLRRMLALSVIITSGGCFTTAAIYHQIHPAIRYQTVYVDSTEEVTMMNNEEYYEYYDTRCLFDPETQTYYIFDLTYPDRYGIVEQIYSNSMDEYMLLTDPITQEYVYCYKSYAERYTTFKSGEQCYVIPHNMTRGSINASEFENYTMMTNTQDNEMRFVPNYILPEYQCIAYQSADYEDNSIVLYEDSETILFDTDGNIKVKNFQGNITNMFSPDASECIYETEHKQIIFNSEEIIITNRQGYTLARYNIESLYKQLYSAQNGDESFE